MRLGDFVPPAAARWVARVRNEKSVGQPRYGSYEEARAAGNTYEDQALVESVLRKTARRREQLRLGSIVVDRQMGQNLFVLSWLTRDKSIEVIDLGGAFGNTFFEANYFLPGKIRSWRVVETVATTERARQEFGADVLQFYSETRRAAGGMINRDLAMALGVFEYTPEPEGALRDWLALGCRYAYLSRTLISTNMEEVVITRQQPMLSQHGPGRLPPGVTDQQTAQVLTIVPEARVRAVIKSSGYRVECEFDENNFGRRVVEGRRIETKQIGCLLKKV